MGAGIDRERMDVSKYPGWNSNGSTDARRGAFDGVDVGTRILTVGTLTLELAGGREPVLASLAFLRIHKSNVRQFRRSGGALGYISTPADNDIVLKLVR